MKIKLFLIVLVSFCSLKASALQMKPVESRLQDVFERSQQPIAIFDLDETLLHSTARRLESYRLALTGSGLMDLYYLSPADATKAQETFQRANVSIFNLKNEYDSGPIFSKIGIHHQEFIKKLDSLMLENYLGKSELLALDQPIKGAITFIQYLYTKGTKIYFVSSRYNDTQLEETIVNLTQHRLYKTGQSKVILRNRGEVSADFKARAFREIKQQLNNTQEVALVAENEPENMNLMTKLFPDALPVFRDGAILNTKVSLEHNEKIIHYRTFMRE